MADKFADKFKTARSAKLPAINQAIKKNAPQSDSKKKPPTSGRHRERQRERDWEGILCGLAKLSANMLIVIDQRCWLKRQWAETVLGFGFGFCWGSRVASGNRWHRICVVWVAIKATLCRLSKFLIKYAAECHHYAKRSPWAPTLTVVPTLAQPLRILFANMQGLPPRHLQFTRQCSRGASRRGSGSEPSMCVWVCVCVPLSGVDRRPTTFAPHLLHTRPSPKSLWHFNRIC